MSDRPTVYIETSVESYLVARPSRDVVAHAHQLITTEWRQMILPKVSPYISRYVIAEAGRSDPGAAERRLEAIRHIRILPSLKSVERLAAVYLSERLVPEDEVNDALHLALASYHGIDYLLTSNCRHIAAASVRHRVAEINGREGYSVPILCTPEDLMEF